MFIRDYLNKGDTVWDVGANTGTSPWSLLDV